MARTPKAETKQAPGPTANKGAPVVDAPEQEPQDTPEEPTPTPTTAAKEKRGGFGFPARKE